jgi:hypothetical protein
MSLKMLFILKPGGLTIASRVAESDECENKSDNEFDEERETRLCISEKLMRQTKLARPDVELPLQLFWAADVKLLVFCEGRI